MEPGLRYKLVDGWEKLPKGYAHRDAVGVAVDQDDRVYVITRYDSRVLIFEPDGSFAGSWGEDVFTSNTHCIRFSFGGSVFTVDAGDHTVRKFSPGGKLEMVLGRANEPSETGYSPDGLPDTYAKLATITHGGPPFNMPTGVAIAPNGEIYVSDGYGNARVHRFAPDGGLIQSWGGAGTGPGEFNLPHDIWVARDGRVFVADRENDRVQIFSPDGEFIDQWTHLQRPTGLFIDHDELVYVSELWWRVGQRSYAQGAIARDQPGRVSVLDLEGNLLSRWGGADRCAPGNFCAPHGICADSKGDVYVAEVTYTFAGKEGLAPADCHTLQKFARI